MADKTVVFQSLDDITADTGIVFGSEGQPFLSVALDRAAGSAETPRRVMVVTALNLASVKPYASKVLSAARVDGSDALNGVITVLAKAQPEAVVFHGLDAYAQLVLSEIAGNGLVTQAVWGDMARQVSNDLRRLSAVTPVLYVTCSVTKDEDDGSSRLAINPGLAKLVLGDLNAKIYVTTRQQDGEPVTLIQENPALALEFKAPRAERKAEEGAAAAAGSGSIRTPLTGNGRERRIR